MLGGGLLLSALGLYQLTYALPSVPNSGGGDCADTIMVALTHQADERAARAAYACFGAALQSQSQGEEAFVRSLRQRGGPPSGIGRVTRVADQRTGSGGRVVFYTVEVSGDSIGYIIYLDRAGKVQRID
jgi:hypothetical protein